MKIRTSQGQQDPQRDPMADPRRERLAAEKSAREVSRLLEILDNLECERPKKRRCLK